VTSPARRLGAAALGVVAALALSACTGEAASSGPKTPQLQTIDTGGNGLLPVAGRQPAPVLRGETLAGEQLDLADLRGQVVVLNFWASWCAPCRAEAGNLIAVAEQTKADGVAFVGINVKDDADAALAFERKQGVTYPSLHDQPGVLLTRFRGVVPQVPPTTLLVDREGRLAGRFIGGVTESELLGPVQVLAKERT
jgi:thiol-disulfide isomerase/thioredoxin